MGKGERHALITGSSRGIGRGIALALAADGVKIAIHYYRNESAAKATLAQVRQRGSDGVLVQADVADPAQIISMFKTLKAEFGQLDSVQIRVRTHGVPVRPAALPDKQPARNTMTVVQQPVSGLLDRDSPLDAGQKFSTFITGGSNRLAHAAEFPSSPARTRRNCSGPWPTY